MTYKIILEPQAIEDLTIIKNFITKNDSQVKATNFLNKIKKQIKILEFMPYKHRKSFYYDDEETRDLIFKGYTIVFKITTSTIYILTIFRQRNH
ncbi:type II toxin-antitoxin system RelE/ParE family toxin [Aliarcobacter vitoriensis]|uniref:type II toxin-antitoxin system RelE/ParE family toxin n=1 Tax=Aliarcobacter vitoriensis TaxID=2011099 RepID=UPI003AAF29CE